jgi:hypothetical protein
MIIYGTCFLIAPEILDAIDADPLPCPNTESGVPVIPGGIFLKNGRRSPPNNSIFVASGATPPGIVTRYSLPSPGAWSSSPA